MLNSDSRFAIKRVVAGLLGMAQTRLELMGLELLQTRRTTIHSLAWALMAALAAVFASLFFCFLLIVLVWDSHRILAIAGCAIFYTVMGIFFYLRTLATLAQQGPLFEATIAEFGRDKDALLNSLSDKDL